MKRNKKEEEEEEETAKCLTTYERPVKLGEDVKITSEKVKLK